MSKGTLLRKLVCILLCSGLASKGLVAQKNYGNPVAETEVRNYFTAHAAQFGVKADELNSLKVTTDFVEESAGIRHIYIQQLYNGLDVVNGVAALHLTAGGQKAVATYQFAKLTGVSTGFSAYTPATAVQRAMAEVNIPLPVSGLQIQEATSGISEKTVFKAANTSSDIPVRKAYLLNESLNKLTGAWEVQLYRRDLHNYWIIYLDGTTGKVISKTDMVVKCDFGHEKLETDESPNDINGTPVGKSPSITLTAKNTQQPNNVYHVGIAPNTQIRVEDAPVNSTSAIPANQYRVYDRPYEAPNHPGATHSLSSTAGNAKASPDGWHKVANAITYQYTRGNNVWAFQDPSPGPLGGVPDASPARTAYNNGGLLGTPATAEPFLFDYAVNLSNDPTSYQKAAIVNLFYWNNLMHDVFYQFGFTEANRNFEDSHIFSDSTRTGGVANDAVLAQAQDGGGTNNANFLTVQDGVAGQMQMYLWTGSVPDSIVRITTSTTHPPANGQKYFSIQGSFGNSNLNNTPIDSTDLYQFPVLNKPYVLVQKNAAAMVGTSSQGCGTGQMSVALPPANNVMGKIVLIDRGNCSFVEKVYGAQLGGAAGVIVINNVPGAAPIAMGGTDAPTNLIRIPAVMVSYEAGAEMKAALAASGDGSIIGSLQKSTSAARRDGDLDNGVVSHEYGHGISTRLTAGGPNPTGKLTGAEQGGEGWSDNFALYMSTSTNDILPATTEHPKGVLPNRGIGSYVVYQPHGNGLGIREYQYSYDMKVNPSTFGYAKLPAYAEAHSIGFLWCTMLYDLQQLMIDRYGFNNDVYNPANPLNGKVDTTSANKPGGNNVAMRLVMQGLMLQPAGPTFIDQRNAILKADTLLYGGQNSCDIWKAFARRGLGYSAVSGTNALGDEVEQFDVSPLCNPQVILKIVKTADAIMTNKEVISYTITATNITGIVLTASNVLITDSLPDNVTYISSDGGTLNGKVITWPAPASGLARNASLVHTVKVRANHPAPATLILSEDNEGATNKFSSTSTNGSVRTFTLVSTNAYSGTKTWFVQDYDVPGSNANLNLTAPITIPAGGAQLIFNHMFSTEANYDGGVVEISTDNTTWTYLPATAFSKNAYNGSISTTNNPLIGPATLAAFSGGSPGYIQSIASLNAYAGMSIYIRFRFTSDPTGGSVGGGGWWIDDIYLTSGATFVTNTAAANAGNAASKVTTTASTLVIESPCLPSVNLPVPLTAGTYIADAVCVDNFANWMHFTKSGNLLFSVKKTAQTATLTPAKVKVGIASGNGAVQITAPYAMSDYAGKKWFVMRRYWTIDTSLTFASGLPVRFYYTSGEYSELQASATDVTADDNAIVYKFNSSADPNPANGHAGVTSDQVTYPAYSYLGTNNNYKSMEFSVSRFFGGGVGGTAPLILPIAGVKELRATVRNKTIVLNWETTSERDNLGFEILRKAPNEADYKTIGFVNGAGNSSSTIPYSHTDASAAKGTLYLYKLKQVSYNNQVQYSNVANARIVDQAFAFSFSPNPAHNLVTFNINNESRSAVSIEMADMTGKKVKTINAGNESYISTKLSLDNFAKGVYLVTIRSGNTAETQKLVVE